MGRSGYEATRDIASTLFELAVASDNMSQVERTPQSNCNNISTYTSTRPCNVTKYTFMAETPTMPSNVVITSPLEPYAPGSNHLIALTTGITASLLLVAVIFTILITFIPLILCLKSRQLNRPTVSTLKTGEMVAADPSNKMTEIHTTSNHDGLQGKNGSSSPRDDQVEEIETTVNEAYATVIGTKKNEVCGTTIGGYGVVVDNEYECVNW